jgi:hypothetical protein
MSSAAAVATTRSIIYLGMDVHKESITIAVLPAGSKTPTRLERLPNDLPKLKQWIDRVARDGEIRACYEASGAGYVLHRALREWGYACEVIAPSLIPKRAGVQRKHDKRDATDLARLYRAGELVAVSIPTEAEERVRDVVRCRETFQREILKSRHYILKFLARRGFVFREGTNWGALVHAASQVATAADDERLGARPARSARVSRVPCAADVQASASRRTGSSDRGVGIAADTGPDGEPPPMRSRDLIALRHGASDRDRRLAPLRAAGAARALFGAHFARRFKWRSDAAWVDHEGRQHALSARTGPSRMELSASAQTSVDLERRQHSQPRRW